MNPIFSFRELQKKAKNTTNNVTEIKVAVLGNHTTNFFVKALENQLKVIGFNPSMYESDYDQIDITLIDGESELYKFNPEIIVVFESVLKLKDKFYSVKDNESRSNFYNTEKDIIQNRVSNIRANGLDAKIVYFTYELIDDELYGNLFSKIPHSFYNNLWQLNNELIDFSRNEPDFYVFDINKYLKGTESYRDYTALINSDLHYSIDTFAKLSHFLAQFFNAFKGHFKKCLILDLDNTTWGGIIGDDGLENIQVGSLGIGKAFTKLQKWAKHLKERGVILAICSKNTEEVAKEPFEKHSEMVLRLEDISIFVANWENKADNIRYIQEVLNIGFDSMVFLDDNPAERDIVRQSLPAVTVPELPKDPAYYMPYIESLNLFETVSYSENDKDRTSQYQQEAKRKKLISSVTNMDDYLKSLEMEGNISPFNSDDVSRVAQLTQRSNQFNLRTQRYTEKDITEFMNSENHLTYTIKLKDKFGDYGLISVIILEKKNDNTYFVDTWIMSCRVLKRDVEHFALNKIVEDIKNKGINIVTGEYLPTPKNKLVADLLTKLTFKNDDKEDTYLLNLANYKSLKNYIENE